MRLPRKRWWVVLAMVLIVVAAVLAIRRAGTDRPPGPPQ